MPSHPLFHPISESMNVSVRDRIQMALAIADSKALQSLVVNCIPPLVPQQQVGTVSSQVGIPVDNGRSADGILQFEAVQCVLADPQPKFESPSKSTATHHGWTKEEKELARLTQHESEMRTIGQNISFAIAISLLAEAGFSPEQIDDILRLPHYAWFKSWWWMLDDDGNFTIPFLRCLRTLHYPDGSVTLQYRDFFAQTKPPCFTNRPEKALISIRTESQGFGDTLQQINHQRASLNIQPVVLICDSLSELEAQAFIHQGISVYPTAELVLPMQANCVECDRQECPMNGTPDSPVVTCHGFLVKSEFV
jgi:hypothetical protein